MSLKLVREIIRNHLLAEQGLSFTSDDFKDVYATARMAHMGQKRRGGEEYFSHPSEVRNIVRRFYPKDYVSQMAALLHDSLEDAPGLTVDSVEEMEGFIRGSISNPEVGDEVLRVVKSVTHEKGGDYSSYVLSLLGNEKALRVKLADMIHNLSDSPSPRQKEKYRKALDLLSSETNGINPPGISEKHWKKLYSLTESKDYKMKITKRELNHLIRESFMKRRHEAVGDVVFQVVDTTPGISGQELANKVNIQYKDPNNMPVTQDEVFAVLDDMIENSEIWLDEEEDAWYIAGSPESLSALNNRDI